MHTTIEEPTEENVSATPFWAEFVEVFERDPQADAAVSSFICEYGAGDGDVIIID